MHDQQQDRQADYRIAFVPEEVLPDQPWVFIEYDSVTWLAIRQDAVTPETLEETWAAFREIVDQGSSSPATT